VLTDHVIERMWELDITLAEFELLLDGGQVVEETPLPALGRKQVVLVLDWIHRFYVVLVVDRARREEKSSLCTNPRPAGGCPTSA
jgi:hypothetical protein